MTDERRAGHVEMSERMAVVETNSHHTKEKLDNFIDESRSDRARIITSLDDLKLAFNNQRSFVGGIVVAVTSLWAILMAAGAAAWHFLKGST